MASLLDCTTTAACGTFLFNHGETIRFYIESITMDGEVIQWRNTGGNIITGCSTDTSCTIENMDATKAAAGLRLNTSSPLATERTLDVSVMGGSNTNGVVTAAPVGTPALNCHSNALAVRECSSIFPASTSVVLTATVTGASAPVNVVWGSDALSSCPAATIAAGTTTTTCTVNLDRNKTVSVTFQSTLSVSKSALVLIKLQMVL